MSGQGETMVAPRQTALALYALLSIAACTPGTGGDTGEASLLAAEPEVIHHPNQPMIVDVIVELAEPGEVEATHVGDPGVRIASLAVEDEGRRHHLRVRGLAPDTDHELSLSGTSAGTSAEESLAFRTDYWLPGFRPSFEVEVHDPEALDSAYRMFDYSATPLWDPNGIFVVDNEGVTRWYYEGGSPIVAGPTAIWAGIEMLDDGSILALRDGAITIIVELGEQRLNYLSFDFGLAAWHHEVILMANGNFLALGNSFQDVDYSSVDPEIGTIHVAADLLAEISPEGELVWTWDAFEHLDPLRMRAPVGAGLEYLNPETGEPGYDWTHGNGMVHTADDDVILLSMRHQDWVIAIDHQSGEVLWRLGEGGDFELTEGTWFYHQHSPQWQADGSLLLYDNGLAPSVAIEDMASRAVRYSLDFDAMSATQVWEWADEEPFLSSVASDADRTPSGNVLVLDSSLQPDSAEFDVGKNYSRMTELPYEGAEPIWSLETKVGSFVYRASAIDQLPGELAD